MPEGYYTVPIGKCDIVREGTQITIVTYGTMIIALVGVAISFRGCDACVARFLGKTL